MSSIEILDGVKPATRAGHHVIASIRGSQTGPTLIILGSIHGNEPAGTRAALRVLSKLAELERCLRGEVILLTGNTRALERKVRYIDTDLNRLWTSANIQTIKSGGAVHPKVSEAFEQRELLAELEGAFARARAEIFFVDLHTTSAPGKPFATVGDTLRNRRFALNFPVTIVLGLEEQLDGTLLECVNNLGVITMGLEAGQHDAASSTNNHEAVIWIATVTTGNLRRQDVPELNKQVALLAHAAGGRRVVEVRHRHAISPADEFKMEPGFTNFQPVRRGQLLAHDRKGEITARETGLVLLPLYQGLGDDGFFLGREVRKFWLSLSALLRRMKIGNFVHLLPGVRRDPLNENFLIVNTRIARILPLQIFHLLGLRRRRWVGNHLVVSRRAFDLQGPPESKPPQRS
ncbi:MAG TPA: succinylglutamate desuccinylase/aspartoacylase family protein [Pyrinomonadaceae bacterium]|jgi:succinylglutamate desuccinylase